jgi:hydroxypyruvate isomerase
MPRYAANLTMLFNELPFLDRFEAAATAKFEAVEFLFPYAYAIDEIKQRLTKHALSLVLHNLPAGNWESGERGIACIPGREQEFRDGVSTAIRYATALGVSQLNCLVGKAPEGVDSTTLKDTLLRNLRYAAEELAAANINLLVEPINTFDIPGFYLHRTEQAIEVLDEVAAPNAFLQYDIYHAQRSEGELGATLKKYLGRIAHIQLADNPGRNEPGTGEINYAWLLRHLDEIGYAGWVGCEYKPIAFTEQGLGWRERLAA